MLIECRARRVARDPRIGRKDRDIGTKAKVAGKIYHFRPQPELVDDGMDTAAHICEISDPRAIKPAAVKRYCMGGGGIDPLAGAKRLHKEWLSDMLSQPVKEVAKELHRYNPQELLMLIEAEKKGKNRASMVKTLLVAKDEAEALAAAVPDLPPDDDLNLE